MRLLTELPPGRAARLADALLADGRPAEVRPDPADAAAPAAVWVVEEDDLTPAKETLAAFLADPDAPRFVAAAKEADRLRAAAAKEQKAAAARARRARAAVSGRFSGGDVPLWRRAPASAGLLAACCVVALFGWGGTEEPWSLWDRQEPLLKWLWITPTVTVDGDAAWIPADGLAATFETGQVWRLVTPMLLHGDPVHLLFNMSWLVGLGALLEARFGSGRFLAAVLAVAALSNVAEFYLDLGFGEPVLGLLNWSAPSPFFGGFSGVAVGLFGFELGRLRGGRPVAPLSPVWTMITLVYLAFCLTGDFGPVANVAHFTGLGLGFAGGLFTARREARPAGRSG